MANEKNVSPAIAEKPPVVPAKAAKAAIEPVYSVGEFMAACVEFGATVDIVHAAFKVAGKSEATKEEARKIINEFKTKEVK